MIKCLCFLFCLIFSYRGQGQTFLNGSFELTISDKDTLNIPDLTYDYLMPHSTSFGTKSNVDILKSDKFCGLAQHGTWYIALTGGATDQVSLKLSEPLVVGRSYSITFYDRMCPEVAYTIYPTQIGVSTKSDEFGELIYTAPNPNNEWTLRNFEFTALSAVQYVTVRIYGGSSFGTWTQIDNFSITCTILSPLGDDTTICEGTALLLKPAISNSTFIWQNGSQSLTYNVTQPGKFWVIVNTGYCIGSDTININFQKCSGDLFIPNAFTPNNDNVNDIFRIQGYVQNFEMFIYNRWGVLVFHTKNMQEGWNGSFRGNLQPLGTYAYIIRYNERNNNKRITKGIFTLIR